LDVVRSARRRRETCVGPWLPEPIVDAAPALSDPADRIPLDDSISYALLVALEALSSAERAASVLHDLFGLPFAEVALRGGRTPAAVRQLAARARRHVSDGARPACMSTLPNTRPHSASSSQPQPARTSERWWRSSIQMSC
jgi:RNA polymerase sigma-70 factor (ECF subfamily)